MKRDNEFQEDKLKEVLTMLREFEMEAALPILELLAFLLNSGSVEFQESFETHLMNNDFNGLYNLVAKESVNYKPKNEIEEKWWRRLFTRRHPNLVILQNRGKQLLESEETDKLEIDVNLDGDRFLDLFCRSIGILEIIMECRERLNLDLGSVSVLEKLMPETKNQELSFSEKTTKDALEQSKWDVSKDIYMFIYRFQRSLALGAIELFTPEELQVMKDKLNN